MAKKTNKCIFAGGFGLSFLVYFCATNFSDITVINNNEKGGPLNQIKDINARVLPTLQKNQVFLDYLTGDYYEYDQLNNSWVPKGNVGLHYSRANASIGDKVGGELIKKVSTYHQKNNDHKPVLFLSKMTDVKCIIKKQYVSHWIVESLPQEFIVENQNNWDPHPVNITDVRTVKQNYDTIAESERGPQIVTHLNSVVTQFHIDKKYPHSIEILFNYVKDKIIKLQSQDKLDMTLQQSYERNKQNVFKVHIQTVASQAQMKDGINSLYGNGFRSQQNQSQSNGFTKKNSINNDSINNEYKDSDGLMSSQMTSNKGTAKFRPQTAGMQLTFTKEFQHSGLGYSKRRGVLVVDNNAMSQQSIPAPTIKEQNAKLISQRSTAFSGGLSSQGILINSGRGSNGALSSDNQKRDSMNDYVSQPIDLQSYRPDSSRRAPSASILSRNNYQDSQSQHQQQQPMKQSATERKLQTTYNQQANIKKEYNVIINQLNQGGISRPVTTQINLSRVQSAVGNRHSMNGVRVSFAGDQQNQNEIGDMRASYNYTDIPSQNAAVANRSSSTQRNHIHSISQNIKLNNNNNRPTTASSQTTTLKHLRNYQIEKEFKEKLTKDAEEMWKNQKEIRQMLHPTLCDEFLPEERDMTTQRGLLSASKSSQSLIMSKKNKNVVNQTPSRKIYSMYKDFQKMPQYNPEIPIIRNASEYIGCEEEQLRRQEIERKKKWLVNKDFKSYFGTAITNTESNYIKNYVSADPSNPPMLHQFRKEDRDKWVKGPFIF